MMEFLFSPRILVGSRYEYAKAGGAVLVHMP